MPWRETAPVDERDTLHRRLPRGRLHDDRALRAVRGQPAGRATSGSRATTREGAAGLADRSRAPHRCPHQIDDAVAELLVAARREHPRLGRRRSCSTGCAPRHPTCDWPAISTVGDLLKRRGIGANAAPTPRHATHPGVVPPVTHAPNDLWTADFKGQFRTGDGEYCYPLTVADLHTRYLLGCHGLRSTRGTGVRTVFERLFREYGLPRAIRTDNGVPFATTGLHGLSHAQRVVDAARHSAPTDPAGASRKQNGAHERMHKTLKREAIRPPRARRSRAQQRAFNRFRAEYNDERPHQALGGAHAGLALSALPAPLPGTAAAPRVPADTSS